VICRDASLERALAFKLENRSWCGGKAAPTTNRRPPHRATPPSRRQVASRLLRCATPASRSLRAVGVASCLHVSLVSDAPQRAHRSPKRHEGPILETAGDHSLDAQLGGRHATASKPLRAISDSSFNDAPCGRFSPRSHWLTMLVVTLR